MQQLAQDMRDMEELLLPLCESMMKWSSKNIYEDFQDAVQPVTALVSLLLNNKQVLAECGVEVEEAAIMGILEKIVQALEEKNELQLLDSIYYGYLPWISAVREQIEQFLSRQEG